MFNKRLWISILLVFPNLAYADNFNYTYLGADVGNATLDKKISINGYAYKELAYASLQGSYQVLDNIVLSVETSAMGKEAGNTKIIYSSFQLVAAFPIPLGSYVDVMPFTGFRYDDAEVCISDICAKADESAIEYGAQLRAWLIPNKVELNVKFLDANSEGFDSEFSAGGAFMITKSHQINVSHRIEDSLSLTSIGYRYNW